MKLRTLFILDAIVSLLVALGFLLGPDTLLKFFGLSTGKTELLLTQVIGAALVGFGALAWFGKDAEDLPAIQGITASLLIFNLRGQLICSLVDGTYQPGTHVVHWDGRNQHGEPVGSGVYLYRVQAGGFASTRKSKKNY